MTNRGESKSVVEDDEIEALSYEERIVIKAREIWDENPGAGLADMAVALDAENIPNKTEERAILAAIIRTFMRNQERPSQTRIISEEGGDPEVAVEIV